MDIIANLKESLKYSADGLVGHWKRWIILIIGTIIFPILMGYGVKVMKGEDPSPELGSIWSLFVDGLKWFVIGIVYVIIPLIVLIVGIVLTIFMALPLDTVTSIDTEGIIVMFMSMIPGFLITCIVFAILMIIVTLYSAIGVVNFARTGSMSAAFDFGSINKRIGKIGWLKYILAIIAVILVSVIINLVIEAIGMPDITALQVLSGLITLILLPFIQIFTCRYYSNLYDDGEESVSVQ